ncbi:PABPC3 [Symbiodinium natans]|uniref:PABPC3 protein n=1 Tax=Symbiodinium natans TaxID=878477 RepID=A0A812NLU0_9DINO|nr:PABPC3 [Symbiodinium natans]
MADLNSMLLQHLASAGLGRQVLEDVDTALRAAGKSMATSDLTKVYDCAMQGQLRVRACLLSGRECSVSVSPWTTVAETKAMLTSELDIQNNDYSLASEGQVLPGDQAIGRYVSPTSGPLALVFLDPIAMLANELDSASPPRQKQLIGERLFPKVFQAQPTVAGKITGMLLELDNHELLSLLASDLELQSRIDEAVAVLQGLRVGR